MIADIWGQALALMLAWPPVTPTEIEVWMTLGGPSARAVRSWLTVQRWKNARNEGGHQ